MALSRVKTWANGEALTHTDLNAEFDNILNNALSLVSPWTGNMAAGGFSLTGLALASATNPSVQFTGDTNTGIFSSGADIVDITAGGATVIRATGPTATAVATIIAEDARTNSVDVPLIIQSTTTGVPAASIGVGLQFNAESADENPSVAGRLDFVFSDVTAGSEDSDLVIMARTAGAAVAEVGRITSTGGYQPSAAAPANPVPNTLYRDSIVKGWLSTSGAGAWTIDDDLNVTSITDNGTGDMTINWATAMASVDYGATVTIFDTANVYISKITAQTANGLRIVVFDTAGVLQDPNIGLNAIVVGDN